jgi:hypothetical protein
MEPVARQRAIRATCVRVSFDLGAFRIWRHRFRSVKYRALIHGPTLFWFAVRDELSRTDPFAYLWQDGVSRSQRLV